MPPLYRVIETSVYSLFNFIPFLFLAMYPFRNRFRFSVGVTIILSAILSVIQVILGFWASFSPGSNTGLISLLSIGIYGVFYITAVSVRLGKALFTLLMISNIDNCIVVASKYLEGVFFLSLLYRTTAGPFLYSCLLLK